MGQGNQVNVVGGVPMLEQSPHYRWPYVTLIHHQK
jgi:hypothetical protein